MSNYVLLKSVKEGTAWYRSNLFGKDDEIVQSMLGATCDTIEFLNHFMHHRKVRHVSALQTSLSPEKT